MEKVALNTEQRAKGQEEMMVRDGELPRRSWTAILEEAMKVRQHGRDIVQFSEQA